MRSIKPRTIWATAKTQYLSWLFNPRMLTIIVMLIFMKTLAVEPLIERSLKMGSPLHTLEPFIAIGNSSLLILFLPAVFLVLMSDFPVINGNTLFFIKRTGKTNWFLGQTLFAIMSIVAFISIVAVGSLLPVIGRTSWGANWSEVVRTYDYNYPEEIGSFASQLLPSNLYNQIPIFKAALHTYILLSLYLVVIVLILFLFKVLNFKKAGLFASIAIIAVGMATASVNSSLMWALPMANSLIWLHYTVIFSDPIVSLEFSYAYFLSCILVLLILCFLANRRCNVANISQV